MTILGSKWRCGTSPLQWTCCFELTIKIVIDFPSLQPLICMCFVFANFVSCDLPATVTITMNPSPSLGYTDQVQHLLVHVVHTNFKNHDFSQNMGRLIQNSQLNNPESNTIQNSTKTAIQCFVQKLQH